MEKRVNAGYEITECIELGGVEYVLGVHPKEHDRFVTWKSSPDRPDYYYWGHYTDSLLKAKVDLYKRVMDEAQYLMQKAEQQMEHEKEKKAAEKATGNPEKERSRDRERER